MISGATAVLVIGHGSSDDVRMTPSQPTGRTDNPCTWVRPQSCEAMKRAVRAGGQTPLFSDPAADAMKASAAPLGA